MPTNFRNSPYLALRDPRCCFGPFQILTRSCRKECHISVRSGVESIFVQSGSFLNCRENRSAADSFCVADSSAIAIVSGTAFIFAPVAMSLSEGTTSSHRHLRPLTAGPRHTLYFLDEYWHSTFHITCCQV